MPLLDMSGVLSKPIVESVYAVCNNCSRITVIISSIQLTFAIGGVAYAKLAGIGIGICMWCGGVCRCTSGHTASVKGGMVSVDYNAVASESGHIYKQMEGTHL